MKICFNGLTKKIAGINLPASPAIFSIDVSDSFNLSKTVSLLNGYMQKTNEFGESIYKCFDSYGDYKMIAVKDENDLENIKLEYINIEPVLIENYVENTVSLNCDYEYFTFDEVIYELQSEIVGKDNIHNILVSDFIGDESIYDLLQSEHSANTGIGVLQLLPGGMISTKILNITSPSRVFHLKSFNNPADISVYLNDERFIEGTVTLTEDTTYCVVSFVNNTDDFINIGKYIIYREN